MVNFEFFIVDKNAIFSQCEFNKCLIKIDTRTWGANIISCQTDELYRSGLLYNNNLVVYDQIHCTIDILNKSGKKLKSISLLRYFGTPNTYAKLEYFSEYDVLWVISINKILSINLNDGCCEIKKESPEKIVAHIAKEGYIYLLLSGENNTGKIMQYCLDTNKESIVYELGNGEQIKSVYEYKGAIYFLSKINGIYKLDLFSNELSIIVPINILPIDYDSVSQIIITENKIWIISTPDKKEIHLIDRNRNSISRLNNYPLGFKYAYIDAPYSLFGDNIKIEDKVLVAPRRANYLLEINSQSGDHLWHKIKFCNFTNDSKKEMKIEVFKHDNLEFLLSYLKSK